MPSWGGRAAERLGAGSGQVRRRLPTVRSRGRQGGFTGCSRRGPAVFPLLPPHAQMGSAPALRGVAGGPARRCVPALGSSSGRRVWAGRRHRGQSVCRGMPPAFPGGVDGHRHCGECRGGLACPPWGVGTIWPFAWREWWCAGTGNEGSNMWVRACALAVPAWSYYDRDC